MALGLTPKQIIDKGTHPLLMKKDKWLRVELGDICIIQNGYAFSSKYFNHEKGLPLIRIRDIFQRATENLYSGEYSEDFLVRRNDFLIGMDGDFKISKWPGELGLLNQLVCRIILQTNRMSKEYVFLCIQPYLDAIHSETSAVTVKHLSSKTISEIPIPLPPLPEQRAIVKKIEALFSSLDAGITDLKKAQDQLKIYRQAVLKNAFEGELTKEWRENGVYSLREENLGNILTVSSGKNLTKTKMRPGAIPVYGGNGIMGYHNEYNNDEVKLIIGRVGVKCGVTHLTEKHSWITDNALIVNFYYPQDYDLQFMQLKLLYENLNKLSNSTAQPVISGNQIYAYKVLLPQKEEQAQIVKEIESRLSVCDAVEQQIKDSLTQAEVTVAQLLFSVKI